LIRWVLRVPSSTAAFAYDRDGKTTTVTFNGQVYAASSFDAKQRIGQVANVGGSALGWRGMTSAGRSGSQRDRSLRQRRSPTR